MERQIGRVVCDLGTPVRIVGKFDERGKPLFPIQGAMDFDFIADTLWGVLAQRVAPPEAARHRARRLETIAKRTSVASLRRSLNFCSGCPHNIGVRLAEGQVAWGSPGCHIFAALSPEPTRRSRCRSRQVLTLATYRARRNPTAIRRMTAGIHPGNDPAARLRPGNGCQDRTPARRGHAGIGGA